ncbi:metal-dependent hydrolase [Nocardia arizonensis]|uniref:metal-dependent hydrolase n=1 Tax=Nocardia arizonensis TaxID=1141647 RepID=UPI0006D1CA62|nr:metal-dependent hydrolase [Nocardia arizonensis]
MKPTAPTPTPPSAPNDIMVRPRNVEFDISQSPLHWIPGEPIASHGISVFNFVLPVGERWFCAVYERALPFVRDERLREEMRGFIGQEAMHAKSHDHVLHDYFAQHDIDYARRFIALTEWAERRFYPLLDRLSGNLLLMALKPQICMIAIVEHLTAYLGDWMLNADQLRRPGTDPVILDLFCWHSAEEIEHRFVAFHVAEYFRIKKRHKNIAALIVGLAYEPLLAYAIRTLVNQDPSLPRIGYFRTIREWRAAARRGLLPEFGRVFKQIPVLLSSRYTPAHVGDTAQAVAYLAQSPAARLHSA